jgi:hypothetical protein
MPRLPPPSRVPRVWSPSASRGGLLRRPPNSWLEEPHDLVVTTAEPNAMTMAITPEAD